MHNKTPVHSTWGLLRVCAACLTPRLNLSSKLRPSWEQHARYVLHWVRNGYNKIFSYSWLNTLHLPSSRLTDGCAPRMPFFLWMTTSWNAASVKNSSASTKNFMWPAYSISCRSGKSVLIMKETLWKNNLNFAKDVNFIATLIILSEKKYELLVYCQWHGQQQAVTQSQIVHRSTKPNWQLN